MHFKGGISLFTLKRHIKDELECSVALNNEDTSKNLSPWNKLQADKLSGHKITSLNVEVRNRSELYVPHFIDVGTLKKLAFKIEKHENQITNLPRGLLTKNEKLQEFNVNGCQIESVPEYLFSMNYQMEIIDMSENRIKFLPKNLITNLKNLKTIELHSNDIESIPEGFFKNNLAIEYVDMENCKIKALPGGMLHNLAELKKLYLSKNQISKIPENFFFGNELLETVSLRANDITELPKSFLHGLTDSLKVLYLGENPIDESSVFSGNLTKNLKLIDRINLYRNSE